MQSFHYFCLDSPSFLMRFVNALVFLVTNIAHFCHAQPFFDERDRLFPTYSFVGRISKEEHAVEIAHHKITEHG